MELIQQILINDSMLVPELDHQIGKKFKEKKHLNLGKQQASYGMVRLHS